MLITYKGCTICTRQYTVYYNYSLIGQYKTLPAAKVAATKEHNRIIKEYNNDYNNYIREYYNGY